LLRNFRAYAIKIWKRRNIGAMNFPARHGEGTVDIGGVRKLKLFDAISGLFSLLT